MPHANPQHFYALAEIKEADTQLNSGEHQPKTPISYRESQGGTLRLFSLGCYSIPLIGGEHAYYSPFSGMVLGPPLTSQRAVIRASAHEVAHHLLSPMLIMSFARQLVACIHEYIMMLAGLVPDAPEPVTRHLQVPEMDNPALLSLDYLQHHVVKSAELPQEAFAIHWSVSILNGLQKIAHVPLGLDVKKCEMDDVKATPIEGFEEIYQRYRAVCARAQDLEFLLAMYALNGPYPQLERGMEGENDGEKYCDVEDMRWRWLQTAKNITDPECCLSGWDSPADRFVRAIAAAEEVPEEAFTWSRNDLVVFISKRLPDLSGAVFRRVVLPALVAYPLLWPGAHMQRPLELWSHHLWKSSVEWKEKALRDSEEPPDPRWYEQCPDSWAEYHYPMYLAKQPGECTYAVELRHQEVTGMATYILELEFLREQLFTGQGLHCIFDVIEKNSHRDLKMDHPHSELMEGLWKATRHSQGAPGSSWTKPSCVKA